ncbi:MAG: ribonuclease H-like domain-containing protein [Candidatus Pacearchaeota archaeon]
MEYYINFGEIEDAFIIKPNKLLNPAILDIETTGLNPITDSIICIGLLYKNEEKIFYAKTKEQEQEILRNFLNFVSNKKVLSYVGFNVFFDYAFIRYRSLIHDVPVRNVFLKDLRSSVLSGYIEFMKTKGTTLYEITESLNYHGGTQEHIANFEIPKLYAENKHDLIKEHLRDDLYRTKFLFDKLLNLGFFAGW